MNHRSSYRRAFAAGATLALFGAALGAHLAPLLPEAPPRVDGVLRPGKPVTIELKQGDEPSVWEIEVPMTATGLELYTRNTVGDVEMYVAYGYGPSAVDGYDLAADNIWIEERLFIEASDAYSLEEGTWYVAIAPGSMVPSQEEIRTELVAEFVFPAEHQATIGEPYAFELTRKHGLRAVVELPLDQTVAAPGAYLVEIECPNADVDMTIGPKGLLFNMYNPAASAFTYLGYERVELDPKDFRSEIVLNVFAYQENEHADTIPVRALVQRIEEGATPPLDLCPTPNLPRGSLGIVEPFAAAGRATVAVVGPLGAGSGAVVSADGYVLTCAHILTGTPLESERPPIAIGFTQDLAEAPIASFGAELVDFRQDLDLALLKITGDLLGRQLSSPQEFPFLAPSPGRPSTGAELVGLGYPSTGGSASMVTLTLTRGVVSGWSHEVEGVLVKTDAAVHAGVSGGPFLDAEGRLLGVAVSSLTDTNQSGGLGYLVPMELVPADWRDKLGW